MWLPKDERRLLRGYYVTIGEFDKQHEFSLENLMTFIKSSASSELPPSGHPQRIKKYKEWLKERNRIIIANRALEERGLITHAPQVFVAGCTYEGAEDNPCLTISLTISGYDLGRKYNCWWTRSKLWYDEYIKNHWIWLFICFIVGGVIIQLINWLWAYFVKTPSAK
jgi:hypothetical protein